MSESTETVETCPIHAIRPMRPENLAYPVTMNRRLREEAPVYQDPDSGIWFISRYEDVVNMSMDHKTFSSVMPRLSTGRADSAVDPEVAAAMAEGYPIPDTMLTQDPPLQRRYRKFVDGAFSPRSLKALEPFIEQTSNELIDAFIDEGRCEFLAEFGVQLPLRVIASQIGCPMEDLPLLRKWTEAFIANLSQQLDQPGQVQAAKDMVECQHYFVERIEERRRAPTDDILSKLVNARFDDDKPLDNPECLSMLQQILVAGNETTSSSLTEGMWLLIRNPDQYEMIRQNPSPEMISNLVEEVLRISSPSANMFRRTTRDVEVCGVTIPANSICFARFAAANQDDEQFPDPLKFDITRPNLKEHVAFGKGVHHCLGAALSRREMNGGFKVIFERMENFRLTPDTPEPVFMPNALLHGLARLDLSFDKIR
ncbi:MAG: cytochrome P450 [Pseudomonadales bacterium]|nr:cytochrome P450 [Pseudomonadales bacterium]NIX06648.1 cytochrome P450 [Pseudomonadales bacterium]